MIRSNYSTNVTPQLRVLSDDQVEEIHLATLEVLRRTGVVIKDPEGRRLLQDAGCWLEGERVRIPAHLIEWAIRVAAHRVTVCDRNGAPAMFLEDHKAYYGAGSDPPYIYDLNTGQRRPGSIADVASMSRVVDYLPNVSFTMSMSFAIDVNQAISDLYHFRAMVGNTTKPIVFTAWSLDNVKDIVAMAEIVAGSAEALQRNPFAILYTEPTSPLQHSLDSTQKLLWTVGKGLPVVYTPGLMLGGSGPVTLAGGLIQANAELLSGLLMAQLKREGAAMIYGGGVAPLDMRTMIIVYGAPEFMINTCALTEMARYYRLPMFHFGGCSDSNVFDQQAALEGALWVLLSALSGGNLVHDMGYIGNGLTASYEMLVSMDEVAGLVKRIMGGVEVSDETMALDVIDQVGPGGHFLGEDHTRLHFRENWFPKLLDRSNYETWKQNGSLTLGDRAAAKAREILQNHQPQSLADEAKMALDEIIQQAEVRAKR